MTKAALFPLLCCLALVTSRTVFAQQVDCEAPPPVCAAMRFVVMVSASDPAASGVYIGPGRVVTSRHVVADRKTARVTTGDGRRFDVRIVPSAYPGDLALLEVAGLSLEPAPHHAAPTASGILHAVARDLRSKKIRVYPPGKMILPRAEGKPLGRLHHDAPSGPGNSGGALVDRDGRLVGVIASGGEGRNEAIPAEDIRQLIALSGEAHRVAHDRLGRAYRICARMLRQIPRRRGGLARRATRELVAVCSETRNRQLIDLAGQVLGRSGRLFKAESLFVRSLEQDPHSLNARIGLIVTQFLQSRHRDAIPQVRWLRRILPNDPNILRLAIQAGKLGGDMAFAEDAYGRLAKSDPGMARAMRRFLDGQLPRGFNRGRQR